MTRLLHLGCNRIEAERELAARDIEVEGWQRYSEHGETRVWVRGTQDDDMARWLTEGGLLLWYGSDE